MSRSLMMKNFSSKKYKTIYLKPMTLEELQIKAMHLYLFNKETYINLGDGRAFNEETKTLVNVLTLWNEIRNVRNRSGYIIAKRKNNNSKLMKVNFIKR